MADANRRIARALYDKANASEKREADEFFARLNPSIDGKISLAGFKKNGPVEAALSNKKVFNELDSDSDGFLNSGDVLVLFYYSVKQAITILSCRGCRKLVFGRSYSCLQCLFNVAEQRFALCGDCYGGGKVKHQHPLTLSAAEPAATGDELLRDQALLLKFSDLVSRHARSPTKKDLKKMWKEAKSQNGAGSPSLEAIADNYFKSVGGNDPNSLDLPKFSHFILTKYEEEFLTPGPNTSPATAFLLGQMMRTVVTESHEVEIPSPRRPNPDPRLDETLRINPWKVATTTFKIVEMALTISSLSSMCTIM